MKTYELEEQVMEEQLDNAYLLAVEMGKKIVDEFGEDAIGLYKEWAHDCEGPGDQTLESMDEMITDMKNHYKRLKRIQRPAFKTFDAFFSDGVEE